MVDRPGGVAGFDFGTWTRHTVLIGALEQEFTVNMEITVFPRFNRHAWVDPLVVVL
jgi:hypothetical protein